MRVASRVLWGRMMKRYRIDARRVTLEEFRTELSWPLAALGWLASRLISYPTSSEYPAIESLRACVVQPAQVPAEVIAAFQPQTDQLLKLGFRGRVFHAIDEPDQQTSHYHADFVDAFGQTVARVKRRVFRARTPHKMTFLTEFVSRADDGTFVVTSNSRGDLQLPDSIRQELRRGADEAELWQTHQRRLQEPGLRSRLSRVTNAREVVDLHEQLHQQVVEHQVARRVFVAVEAQPTLSQQTSATRTAHALPGDESEPSGEDSLLLHEVRRQENKRASSPLNALLLLLVSGGLFVALGGFAWSLTFTLFLVPILLFHELGHFLCMKLFDYRNVRMFFIPLFGAAVSGRNYNVAGWKRVVTSLMGPLPGIALGIGLGIVGLVRGYEVLLQGALIMVVINGFNLIPALPLDGGWVVHGLLFSRHAFLDLFFRLGAIGLLLLISAVGGGWVTFGLGIAMIVGLPAAFHSARITDRLRGEPNPFGPPDAGQVPQSAIVRISQELDRAYPKGLALKPKATLALQIYQNVSSPPPGILGTLTLGTIYAGSLVAAIIGASIIVIGQKSDLGELIARGLDGPQQTVSPEEIVRNPPDAAARDFASSETLVTNYPELSTAREVYQQFLAELGPQQRLLLFGTTLLIPLNNDTSQTQRDQWFDRLEASTPPTEVLGQSVRATFLDHPQQRSRLEFACIARSEEDAIRMAAELAGYFAADANARLLPPWDPDASLTPLQQAARRTVAALQFNSTKALDDDSDDLSSRIDAAHRRGRQDEVKKLMEGMYQKQRKRDRARIEELRQSTEGYDMKIVDAYAQAYEAQAASTPADQPVYVVDKAWLEGVAVRLGRYDDQDAHAFSSTFGFVARTGLVLNVYVTFESLPSGLLALVDWFAAQQCTGMRYGISGGALYEE